MDPDERDLWGLCMVTAQVIVPAMVVSIAVVIIITITPLLVRIVLPGID